MFSISTIASSTRMPITRDSDSRVTTLSVKPIQYMEAMKVGHDADSGSATALTTSVARQSRRNNHTTMTASSGAFEQQHHGAVVVLLHRVDEVEGLGDDDVGCARPSACLDRGLACPVATSTSPAPRLSPRDLEANHRLAIQQRRCERCSATVSVDTLAHLVKANAAAVAQSADFHRGQLRPPSATVAMVRTDCSAPPSSARPPGCFLLHLAQLARDFGGGGTQRQQSDAGSSSTRTSRLTPPTRPPRPRPSPPACFLLTWLSTNQDSASSSMLGGRHGVGQDRQARQIHLGDRLDRADRPAGRRGRDCDGIAHIVNRFLGRLFEHGTRP